MKIRVIIVAIGLLIGLACKWAVPGLGNWVGLARNDVNSNLTTTSGTGTAPADTTTKVPPADVDPLVPPIRLPGMPIGHVGSIGGRPLPGHLPSLNPRLPLLSLLAVGDAFDHDGRALFDPHGEEVCASGCAVSRHPTTELTRAEFRRLMKQFAREPLDQSSLALETLLFFGRQTREMIEREGIASLDPARSEMLQRELARTHAKVSIRVVDEDGEIRAHLEPTLVPLDRRHVFSMETNKVQPLVTSGTVKRVGLHHLWTRL